MSRNERNERRIPDSELPLLSYGEAELAVNGLANRLRAMRLEDMKLDDLNPLFVTGGRASGKTAITRASLSTEEYNIVDTGPTLRAYWQYDRPDLTFGEWCALNENNYGPTFTTDVLAAHISLSAQENEDTRKLVIIGNRSMDGINRMCEVFGVSDAKIVYFEAPVEVLHERYQEREQRKISKKDFIKMLQQDSGAELAIVESEAGLVIVNNADFESAVELFREVGPLYHAA